MLGRPSMISGMGCIGGFSCRERPPWRSGVGGWEASRPVTDAGRNGAEAVPYRSRGEQSVVQLGEDRVHVLQRLELVGVDLLPVQAVEQVVAAVQVVGQPPPGVLLGR